MNKKLETLMNTDPATVAESITGGVIGVGGCDNPTNVLAVGIQLLLSSDREKLLTEMGDTTFSNELLRYQEIITLLGFVEVYAEAFTRPERTYNTEPNLEEHLYVWANKVTGCILVFDTSSYMDDGSRVTKVGKAHVHYTWISNKGVGPEATAVTSSGGWNSITNPDWRRDPKFYGEVDGKWQYNFPTDIFWVGDHDARESLTYHLHRLEEHGKFMPVWPKHRDHCMRIFVGGNDFMNFQHTKDETERLSRQEHYRLSKMPEWVHAIINGNMGELK